MLLAVELPVVVVGEEERERGRRKGYGGRRLREKNANSCSIHCWWVAVRCLTFRICLRRRWKGRGEEGSSKL